mgnify:CR=1 FL=1
MERSREITNQQLFDETCDYLPSDLKEELRIRFLQPQIPGYTIEKMAGSFVVNKKQGHRLLYLVHGKWSYETVQYFDSFHEAYHALNEVL